ncbi:MAG TPA: hypothetical protein VMR98_00325, partial [Candidatus Polarisedimenticolaceae bacterium]|nr:hypothetical protein [Candidatus Polarisedimenticolaceae bacterium]
DAQARPSYTKLTNDQIAKQLTKRTVLYVGYWYLQGVIPILVTHDEPEQCAPIGNRVTRRYRVKCDLDLHYKDFVAACNADPKAGDCPLPRKGHWECTHVRYQVTVIKLPRSNRVGSIPVSGSQFINYEPYTCRDDAFLPPLPVP